MHTTLRRDDVPSASEHKGHAYEPALDGLRAVAVLAVMLYHAGTPAVPGGFLGVDLFFVLSGYLITSLLLVEWQRSGTVDLRAFWLRRARRLLPALFLVLAAVAIYSVSFVADEERTTLRDHAIATLLYVGNWWQIAQGHSYFAQFANPSPLEHTWSLAIEEQWYVLFPPLLTLVLTRRWRRAPLLRGAFLVAAAASACLMAIGYDSADPSRVYFSTVTRVQDLLVGAALAAHLRLRGAASVGGRLSPALVTSMAVASCAFIVVAFATVQATSWGLYHFGFLAFSAAAATLVYAVMDERERALRPLLSSRCFVAVGVVSYGLYLWHWPVFVALDGARTGLSDLPLGVVRFATTFALATVSYMLIEGPIRYGALARRLGSVGEAVLAACAVVTVAMSLVTPAASAHALASDGAGAPTGAIPAAPLAPAGGRAPSGFAPGAVAPSGRTSVFFVGDSVPYNLRQNFEAARRPEILLDGTTRLGCGLFPERLVAGDLRIGNDDCDEWSATWPQRLAAVHPNIAVLFAGIAQLLDIDTANGLLRFGTAAHDAYLRGKYVDTLRTLKRSAARVAIVDVACTRVYDDHKKPVAPLLNDHRRVQHVNGIIRDVAASEHVALIDIDSWLCPGGRAPELDTRPIKMRFDGLHYTHEGAQVVWDWLAPQLLAMAPTTETRIAAADHQIAD